MRAPNGILHALAVALALVAALATSVPAPAGEPRDPTLGAWRAARREAVRARSLAAVSGGMSNVGADTAGDKALADPPLTPARFALLVIPVDFADHRLPVRWDPASLAPRLTAADGQSLHRYFQVASAGRCEVAPVVAPLVRLPGTARDYSDVGLNGFTRTRRLAREALTAVAVAGFDFRLCDDDGPDGRAGSADDDGWVDGVLILHAEAGQENDAAGGLVQALQYYLDDPVVAEGTSAGPYAVASLHSGPGIWAHETAHLLGMEDRYDPLLPPDEGAGDLAGAGGLGVFSLMAAGARGTGGGWNPSLPDAYSRALLGWCDVSPAGLVPTATDTLVPAPDVAGTRRLWTRGEPGPEFLLLEARDPATVAPFDGALPGRGLVVVHVDESVPEGAWQDDGFGAWHLRTRLIEADGDESLRSGEDTGSAGDLFPGSAGVDALSPSTAPSTAGYDGASGVEITGIRLVGGNAGVAFAAAASPAPWCDIRLSFAAVPPLSLNFAADLRGGQASGLVVVIEALGEDGWGAFGGGSRSLELPLEAGPDGRWRPTAAPSWEAAGDLPDTACTNFRCVLTGDGLAARTFLRAWCWGENAAALDFASTWPGAWETDQPDGPGTTWHRWTGADSPAPDGRPVLACTGEAADPADWPLVTYTNGGRARLTSRPLRPGDGGVNLLHWVDVETLPGGVPMDGAVVSWVGPDEVESPAVPLGGYPARVAATSASALHGRASFGEQPGELDGDNRPVWRSDVFPLPGPEVGPGPWRLRLELAANGLWRGRGWLVADLRYVPSPVAEAVDRLDWDGDLDWTWTRAPDGAPPDFTVQGRTLPDSAWTTLANVSATHAPGPALLALLPGSPGSRHELRVTGPTAWGILALAPVVAYVDGGAGREPALGEPWPNPAPGEVRCHLVVPDGATAHWRIYDLRGRLVYERAVGPGLQFVAWDGADRQGRRLPSGTYLLKLDGAGAPVTRKVVLRH